MNRLISFLVLLILLSSCGKLLESSYSNYNEVVEDDAIRRGWIPFFLPKSASNIREVHDLDTNEVWLVFNLDPKDAEAMAKSCTSIPLTEIVYPSQPLPWWPEKLDPNYQGQADGKPEETPAEGEKKEETQAKDNKSEELPDNNTKGKNEKQQEDIKSKNDNDKDAKTDENPQDSETEDQEPEIDQFYQCDRTAQYANGPSKIPSYLAVTEDKKTAYYWRPGR